MRTFMGNYLYRDLVLKLVTLILIKARNITEKNTIIMTNVKPIEFLMNNESVLVKVTIKDLVKVYARQ